MEITREFLGKYYYGNLNETKKKVKMAVSIDNLIILTIKNLDDLQKAANLLCKRLRDWYALYNPEFEKKVSDNKRFSDLIVKKNKEILLKEICVKKEDSMGAEFQKVDLDEIMELAKEINNLYSLIEKHEKYLEEILKKNCPNMTEITGALIGAKLIEHSGSIKHLATMTSSTVQLLGAEKALFRHMKTGARSPKHGLIIQHPLVSQAKASDKGKAARAVADKISIAIRVDYFKGKFIGDKLKRDLEAKLKL